MVECEMDKFYCLPLSFKFYRVILKKKKRKTKRMKRRRRKMKMMILSLLEKAERKFGRFLKMIN
jgi:hypothetical protein